MKERWNNQIIKAIPAIRLKRSERRENGIVRILLVGLLACSDPIQVRLGGKERDNDCRIEMGIDKLGKRGRYTQG